MQRQSLGGSGSKLHVNVNGGPKEEKKLEEEVKKIGVLEEDEKNKIEKLYHHHPTEKSIHLIPLLTLFCLLVLYLCSYDPSQKDLAHINGFTRPSNTANLIENDDFKKYLEIKKGDMLAIRSHRSLLIKHGRNKTRLNRKFGGF